MYLASISKKLKLIFFLDGIEFDSIIYMEREDFSNSADEVIKYLEAIEYVTLISTDSIIKRD